MPSSPMVQEMYWNFYWQKNSFQYIKAFHASSGRGQASPLQRQRFLVLGDRNSDAFWRSSCRLVPTQPPGGRLPTLRSPTRFGVQFKLVRFYYAQRRAGRPRSSPFPLRGIFFSLPRSGELMWYNESIRQRRLEVRCLMSSCLLHA
ncbi:MAG: hypothetical protein LBQ66_11120 [Planctomycetaceae bacterium]|nr:hypothetical protein [Planctomycetaceae bacterium]